MKKALFKHDNVLIVNIGQVRPPSGFKCYFEIVLINFNKYFTLCILAI